MYLFQEIFSLRAGRCLCTPEMIRSSYETIFTCLIKIIIKTVIQLIRPFSSFDYDKTNRTTFYHCLTPLSPIYFALIVTDINTMNFISFRIRDISIKSLPSKTGRTYEKIIECPDTAKTHQSATDPHSPTRHFLQYANHHARLFVSNRMSIPSTLLFIGSLVFRWFDHLYK